MKRPSLVGGFFRGWWDFVRSGVLIIVWWMLHALPLYALPFLGHPPEEARAGRLTWAQTLVIVGWFFWAPFVSSKVGMVRFEGGMRREGAPEQSTG